MKLTFRWTWTRPTTHIYSYNREAQNIMSSRYYLSFFSFLLFACFFLNIVPHKLAFASLQDEVLQYMCQGLCQGNIVIRFGSSMSIAHCTLCKPIKANSFRDLHCRQCIVVSRLWPVVVLKRSVFQQNPWHCSVCLKHQVTHFKVW